MISRAASILLYVVVLATWVSVAPIVWARLTDYNKQLPRVPELYANPTLAPTSGACWQLVPNTGFELVAFTNNTNLTVGTQDTRECVTKNRFRDIYIRLLSTNGLVWNGTFATYQEDGGAHIGLATTAAAVPLWGIAISLIQLLFCAIPDRGTVRDGYVSKREQWWSQHHNYLGWIDRTGTQVLLGLVSALVYGYHEKSQLALWTVATATVPIVAACAERVAVQISHNDAYHLPTECYELLFWCSFISTLMPFLLLWYALYRSEREACVDVWQSVSGGVVIGYNTALGLVYLCWNTWTFGRAWVEGKFDVRHYLGSEAFLTSAQLLYSVIVVLYATYLVDITQETGYTC